jgi:hypothetical protein
MNIQLPLQGRPDDARVAATRKWQKSHIWRLAIQGLPYKNSLKLARQTGKVNPTTFQHFWSDQTRKKAL